MSKLCFLFFSFTLYTSSVVESNVINTGTVLFSSSDVHRHCWHPEEVAVLTTRLILQDLLPEVSSLVIDDNSAVNDVVDYFRFLIEIIQKSTQGRTRHVTMLALTDLIGGYLQHAILPMSRHAYYAGVIDFLSMEKLIQLYEELKWFLRTNGQGWTGPMKATMEYEIQPIDLSIEGGAKGNKTCCRNLIYYQRPSLNKRSADKDKESTTLYFPVPFFDSKVRPTAIAVPFRRYALRNIESKKAAYMVMKYYIAAHNCLLDLHADKTTMDNFQNNLYLWIEKNVMPKLKDDKFYSAFGGIMRVEDTLKAQGAKQVSNVQTECDNEGDQEVGAVPGGETTSRSSIILIAMLVTIFVWFIIGTLFICYRIRRNSKRAGMLKEGEVSSESSSSFGSSKWSSSKRTLDTCKCTTGTERSTEVNSSISSEFDKEDDTKNKKKGKTSEKRQSKSFTFLKKPSKNEPYCFCDEPPTIDPKHSMKLLPSIPEMSENSSSKRDEWKNQGSKSRTISFQEPQAGSSKEDLREARKTTSSKIRACMPRPRMEDIDVTVCPHYDEKATSRSSSRSKSTNGKELGTQMSDLGVHEGMQMPEYQAAVGEKETSNENTTGDTTDNTGITATSPHIYACHSSLTGNYTTNQRFQNEKPFIFGYDFQTSSSSDLSDEESDARTSSTK